MDYIQIANNKVFIISAVIITLLVAIQAVLFIKLSFKQGYKLGIKKEVLFKAFRTGFVTSIIPSIPAVVALIAMIPVLGLPLPWIRQTIMGSTPYELTAAGIGAKVMGLSGLGGKDYTSSVFASSIWIMTIGSIWAVLIVVFFLKKLQKKYSSIASDDTKWKVVLVNAAFLGVFSIFIADPIVSGGVPLVTLIAGGLFMTILAAVIVKLKLSWLKEFALTISMVGAMACAAIFSNFF